MCARARRFFARLNRLEFSTPLVEASSGNPEFLGKIIDAFAGLHPLYGGALKLPGISLPSLHWCFLSRRVCPSQLCHFKGSLQTKAESQNRESVNFPTHSAVLSHDGLGNRCKKWARAWQAGAPPRAASVIGVHASQSAALFVALQPEKREHFRGTEPTIYQPKAAPRPLYIPGTKTRIPAEPVTCEHICGST